MRFPERPEAVSFTSGELGSLHGVASAREGDGEGVRGGRVGENGWKGWGGLVREEERVVETQRGLGEGR